MAANNSCENSADEYENIPSPHIPPEQWALYHQKKPVIPSETGTTHQPRKIVQSQPLLSQFHSPKVKKSSVGEYTNVPLHPEKTPLPLSQEMTLEQFILDHEDYLPLQVKVSKGIYGNDDESTISTGEFYNFHFIQNGRCGTI